MGESGRSTGADRTVGAVILDRLSTDNVPDARANLVLAALVSDEELGRAVSGAAPPRDAQAHAEDTVPDRPRRAYLKAIRVAGFRGIGPAKELRLTPGPGLTLVIGRNGSGKSSFAEAAELALTGGNKRWADRSQVWRQGWRNLHDGETPQIDVDLAIDGESGTTTVAREWEAVGELEDAEVYVQAPGRPRQGLATLGWATDLELYRPFLSYSELGALVSGTPSAMHDALEAILGLGQLKDAERRLDDVRKQLDAASKLAKNELPGLLERLAAHPDERARLAERALTGKQPDLAALGALVAGADDSADEPAAWLREVAAIPLPVVEDVAEAIRRLAAAREKVAALAGTAAADARRLADLLSTALDHHADHAGEPCPVCGERVLDEEWAVRTRAEVTRLAGLARDADAAREEHAAAERALATIVGRKPPALQASLDGGRQAADTANGLDPRAASAAWDRWTGLAASGLATDEEFTALRSAVEPLKAAAAQALAERSQAWQPAAMALADWVEKYSAGQAAAETLANVRKAIDWLRAAGTDLRNERLAPFTEGSASVWATLRQESNVELGPVTLAGNGNRRHVSLDVTVDGIKGAALSVMSQGELHALGLALFLPRATAETSPFGFLVIDDPVQSMDPAKVDGLARVLSAYAATRQVVVFTHDDRLPAAIKQLQLPATIWEVKRREHSEITLTKRDDAVSRYIEDAFALANTTQLADAVKAVAVAGMCRLALEAACVEVVRRTRIGAGVPHVEVEKALEDAVKLRDKLALALFNDANRGGDIKPGLSKLGGQAFVAVFSSVRDGVHDPYPGSLKDLARDTEKLAKALRR